MLKIDHISLSVGEKFLFESETCELTSGLVGLIGRNGSGKSTFLRALVSPEHPINSSIFLDEKPLREYATKQLSQKIAIVTSKPEVFGEHTVQDVLLLGRIPYLKGFRSYSAKDYEITNRTIERLSLEKYREQRFNSLSDGEKQLVMIGRALTQDTSMIVLDEPTAFLDVVNKQQIFTLLEEVSKNKLILFSSHQVDKLLTSCSDLLLIDNQKLVHLNQIADFKSKVAAAFKIQL